MTQTITDVFDLPRPQDIRAMGFVIKLRDAMQPDELQKLVADYVVTPAVERELPQILDGMKQVYDRGEEYGRFIHGSFGSGKSHFMTMLSLLLEGVPSAWDKFAPFLGEQGSSTEGKGHAAWIADANLLVVRIHMLSVRGRDTGLDRAVYDGFNAALAQRGKEPFVFLDVGGVFDEVRREAAEYGDLVWKKLETAGIVGSRDEFEEMAGGSLEEQEDLARAWLAYKGRDASAAGIDPRWADGLARMGAHAKAQGYGGIVLLIDEFLLWLAEKSGQEFVREINNLNVVVDHSTGQRPAPIFVFVARQRNLQEFFPDLVDEAKIHEHLDHHSKRFEVTKLQDVELRHIVRGRVLRPKDAAAVAAVTAELAERHRKILPALSAGDELDVAYLRDVYPFHPALIEMLVDVTSLMQRERSALRLLYELLVLHYPTLPLGEFLPVGSAFGAIFPEAGVEASKKVDLMQDIHRQYYERLRPAMQQMVDDPNREFDAERQRALDQLVKTVLLAEVSPRLKQNGLTIERLVHLNSVDVEGESLRGRVRVAETDLGALSSIVADLQVAGSGKTAIVRYVLGRVSLSEILARAVSKVDNKQQRFKVFWEALKKGLGITGLKGFREGEQGDRNEGDYAVTWRRTQRVGRLQLGNVRELSYDDFDPPAETFKLIVDYPWDEPGHTVDEDRLRADNVRKKKGLLSTVCWLPRHMSPTELATLTDLAAVRYLRTSAGQDELLETYGPQERSKILEDAAIRERNLERRIDELIAEVYVQHGELKPLISDIDVRLHEKASLAETLEQLAARLMDRKYPQHPSFSAEPKRASLERLLAWMIGAGSDAVSVPYDDETGKVLRTLGTPLELVNLGQSKASLRLDSRYIKDVLSHTDADSLAWAPVAEHLRTTYGFQSSLCDLFLCFLCQRDHRALDELTSDPVDVRIGMSPSTRLRLQRGKLVSAPEWGRLRDLGHRLLSAPRPAATRSLQGQDRFVADLRERAARRRTLLSGLHESLVELGAAGSPRIEELAEANQRLAPLVERTSDSYRVLNQLLARWPEDDVQNEALFEVLEQAETLQSALSEIDRPARRHLEAATSHATLGSAIQGHLEALARRLAGPSGKEPLTRESVQRWNKEAQGLIQQALALAPVESPKAPPPPPVEPPQPPVSAEAVAPLLAKTVDPADGDQVTAFLADVRKVLQALGPGAIPVALVHHVSPTEDEA